MYACAWYEEEKCIVRWSKQVSYPRVSSGVYTLTGPKFHSSVFPNVGMAANRVASSMKLTSISPPVSSFFTNTNRQPQRTSYVRAANRLDRQSLRPRTNSSVKNSDVNFPKELTFLAESQSSFSPFTPTTRKWPQNSPDFLLLAS